MEREAILCPQIALQEAITYKIVMYSCSSGSNVLPLALHHNPLESCIHYLRSPALS